MGDGLWGFGGEDEVCGGAVAPTLDGGFIGCCIERGVDFNRVELAGIGRDEFFRRGSRFVELADPVLATPALSS